MQWAKGQGGWQPGSVGLLLGWEKSLEWAPETWGGGLVFLSLLHST